MVVKKAGFGDALRVTGAIALGSLAYGNANGQALSIGRGVDAYVDSVTAAYVKSDVQPVNSLQKSYDSFVKSVGKLDDLSDDNYGAMSGSLCSLISKADSLLDSLGTMHFMGDVSVGEVRSITKGLENFGKFYRKSLKNDKEGLEKLERETRYDFILNPEARAESRRKKEFVEKRIENSSGASSEIDSALNYLNNLKFSVEGLPAPRNFSFSGDDKLSDVYISLKQGYLNAKNAMEEKSLKEWENEFFNPQIKSLRKGPVDGALEVYVDSKRVEKVLDNHKFGNSLPETVEGSKREVELFGAQLDSLYTGKAFNVQTPKSSKAKSNPKKIRREGRREIDWRRTGSNLVDILGWDEFSLSAGAGLGENGVREGVVGVRYGPLGISGTVGVAGNQNISYEVLGPSPNNVRGIQSLDHLNQTSKGIAAELHLGPVFGGVGINNTQVDKVARQDIFKGDVLIQPHSTIKRGSIDSKRAFLGVTVPVSKGFGVQVVGGRDSEKGNYGQVRANFKIKGGRR